MPLSGADKSMHAQAVASPCVRNCCLDERDVCMGCGRSLAEIQVWGEADDTERTRILALAARRRLEAAARRRAWLTGENAE